MVISIDKATAVRTFDKVQKHWKLAIEKLRKEVAAADPMDRPELEQRLKYFEETDMAVVVSQSQNEIEEFKKKAYENIAIDGGGHLTYLAPTRVNLALTIERWPELRFFSTREH